ncbi:MAG: DUF2442 domain-containing protein [Myxococcota bacterium]
MTPDLETAEYTGGYTIHLRFADGTVADVDLEAELWGEVFEPLKDPEVFRGFHLDTELNTITWPSGADFAPEFLYDEAVKQTRPAHRSPANP